jgi:Domain of unknown function (DUF4145)
MSTKLLDCIHCNNKALSNIRWQYDDQTFFTDKDFLERKYSEKDFYAELINPDTFFALYEKYTWYILECTTCNKFTFLEKIQSIEYVRDIAKQDSGKRGRILESQLITLYPTRDDTLTLTPNPTLDMPPEIIVDYNEARAVFKYSPQASAALLRLAIQKLCKHLGQPGKNINDDIAALVKTGLPVKIQRALDIVRVIGNNAVHPGELNLQDDQETVLALFKIVNFIIDEMITLPKELEEIYNKLPENARKSIEKRDQTK